MSQTRPPQSGGAACDDPDSDDRPGLSYIPLSGPMRGRSRPHLSLREGSETMAAPREGALKEGRRTYEMERAGSFFEGALAPEPVPARQTAQVAA